MTADELEAYLLEHIPLTRAMGLHVARADGDEVRLSAPLEPNVNHRATAFGGSIATLAIAAGWACLRLRIEPPAQLVIKSCEMEYLAPISGEFVAVCPCPSEKEWGRFLHRLERKGRARITLKVDVLDGETRAFSMEGVYVALG